MDMQIAILVLVILSLGAGILFSIWFLRRKKSQIPQALLSTNKITLGYVFGNMANGRYYGETNGKRDFLLVVMSTTFVFVHRSYGQFVFWQINKETFLQYCLEHVEKESVDLDLETPLLPVLQDCPIVYRITMRRSKKFEDALRFV